MARKMRIDWLNLEVECQHGTFEIDGECPEGCQSPALGMF